jgi:carboxyl-terminal processing protease
VFERKSHLKLNATGLAGVLGVGALTAGAFAAGSHLGPARPVGHNLYRPASAAAPRPSLTLTSAGHPGAVAQRQDGPGASADEDFTSDGPGATFQQVYALVKRHFVDPLPPDAKLAHGAASAMVASLGDPDSRFLEAPEVAEIGSESKGQYAGIGAALAVRRVVHPKDGDVPEYTEYLLTVVAPLPGSPAEKAGLRAGDVITAIGGKWVYNDRFVYDQTKALKALQDDPVSFNKMVTTLQKKIDGAISLAEAQTRLDDSAAKTVTLTVAHAGTSPTAPSAPAVTLDTSALTLVRPISSRSLPGGLGYIKITQFAPGADKDFAAALSGFGTDLKGLVLDLRDSPGGLLDVGTAIAARLTSAPNLGYVETKGKKVTSIVVTPGAATSAPLVVLINGGTANTAELLAAALQSKGAKLVGTPTFGDASDVKLILLRDGSGFTMTVGKLQTVTQAEFAGVGIKPDVSVPGGTGDEVLNRAVGVLSGRVARVPLHTSPVL